MRRIKAWLRWGKLDWVFFIYILICALVLLTSSCTYTDGKRNIALGGKGAARGSDYAVAWDNVESFRDGALLVGAVATSGFSYLGDKAAEGTAQVINNNATKQGINASNNATAVELGAQKTGVETAKILKQ